MLDLEANYMEASNEIGSEDHPLEEVGIRSLGTNSAKCAFYSQNLSRLETRFDTLENLIK